jgi:hypothetical protein
MRNKYKNKCIPVTDRRGLLGCAMLRIAHCLDDQLTGGGKVVSLMRWPSFTSQKH